MSKTRKPHDDGTSTAGTLFAILAAVGVASIMLIIVGSVSNVGNREANAAPLVLFVPDQAVSAEDHSAFIREAHGRAAREGDGTPVPSPF